MKPTRSAILSLLIALTLSACASPRSATEAPPAGGSAPAAPSAPKRLVAVIQGSPAGIYQPPNLTDRPRGVDEITLIVHAFLSIFDTTGQLRPELAEAVPSVDNGLWTLQADGTMATTWKIRGGARWHDGTPFTTD